MQELIQYISQNLLLAVVLVLVLYAFKSATVILPIVVLEIAVGHLFSFETAMLINILGGVIVHTIPYWMGHFLGIEAIEKLMNKSQRFEQLLEKQQSNSFFICFWLRIVCFLPGDVVTMYFGATKVSFSENLIGGILGILPGMFLSTLLGSSVRDIHSPAFWVSAVSMAVLSLFSIVFYYLYKKHSEKKEE